MTIEAAYNSLLFQLRMGWQERGLDRDEATARAHQDIDVMTNTALLDALSQHEEKTDDQST